MTTITHKVFYKDYILLSTNCKLVLNFIKKINKLTFNFNLRYFCLSVNYLTLTELKNYLKIFCELIFNEVNASY